VEVGVDLPIERRAAVAARHGVYEPPWPERDSPPGVMGQPAAASAETGQRIIDAAAAKLSELVKEFAA